MSEPTLKEVLDAVPQELRPYLELHVHAKRD